MGKRHPGAIAFDFFAARWPELFEGTTSGKYLRDRIRTAFQEGWIAAERAVESALNNPREDLHE